MKNFLKPTGAGIILAGAALAATLAQAQNINWNSDPLKQIPTLHYSAPTLVSAAGSGTVSLLRVVKGSPITVILRCSPADDTPTSEIASVLIDGHQLSQYDGGYIPQSEIHAQGYEFSTGEDMGKNLLFLYLSKKGRPNTSMNLGTLSDPPAACGWQEQSVNKVSLSATVSVTLQEDAASGCTPRIIDSEPVYSKSAELAITFKDLQSNKMETLKTKDGTAATSDLAQCRATPLGGPATVFYNNQYGACVPASH
ncbi:MAG: hypothetical protein ACYCPQ_02510 [Elusimicrobiota bacterium]